MKSPAALLAAAGVAACLLAGAAAAEDSRPFSGTWTLAGTRILLPTGGERPAAVVHASGSLVITKGDVLGKGFLGELVAFDDGEDAVVGRAVFTDEKGDKVFVKLVAERLGVARHAAGTFTGGTGRFSGVSGSLSLSWKYIVAGGTDDFEALAVTVEGRIFRSSSEAPK
jgi:hypothetical protein